MYVKDVSCNWSSFPYLINKIMNTSTASLHTIKKQVKTRNWNSRHENRFRETAKYSEGSVFSNSSLTYILLLSVIKQTSLFFSHSFNHFFLFHAFINHIILRIEAASCYIFIELCSCHLALTVDPFLRNAKCTEH